MPILSILYFLPIEINYVLLYHTFLFKWAKSGKYPPTILFKYFKLKKLPPEDFFQ